MTDPDMKALDGIVAQVADTQPAVPEHLMAAVYRDAVDVQRAARTAPRQGILDTILELIGGWPAVSGLAAAGVAGVWIGVSPPVGLESATGDLWGTTEQVDLFGTDPMSVFAVDEGG